MRPQIGKALFLEKPTAKNIFTQDHLQTENIPACIAGFASLAIMTAAILTLGP